ncbi:hypothetical protein NLG97_g6110 [Lecanicillium saksenae]|uniref:Uncharacterized protein n=1 Tax=Lecanicillium saksenae TaxID=468837 RepID=A0ACC1QRZ1_9HYPO|nr:hypothetical protein NLG97_g6110 [Lecanicillium saksenae]
MFSSPQRLHLFSHFLVDVVTKHIFDGATLDTISTNILRALNTLHGVTARLGYLLVADLIPDVLQAPAGAAEDEALAGQAHAPFVGDDAWQGDLVALAGELLHVLLADAAAAAPATELVAEARGDGELDGVGGDGSVAGCGRARACAGRGLGAGLRHVGVAREVQRVVEDGRGVAVGKVEQKQRHALLVRRHALRSQQQFDEAGVARARRGGRGL